MWLCIDQQGREGREGREGRIESVVLAEESNLPVITLVDCLISTTDVYLSNLTILRTLLRYWTETRRRTHLEHSPVQSIQSVVL